jgi:ethanolamine permease
MGCMYLLLAMCFAELSSIVAFAGGSFGYCRAALGPFWGFMVGASEMLQNFLFVTATVMTLSTTCTEFFDVSGNLEPLWMALAYAMIFGVHLRGGMLFWYTVMVSGGVTVLLIVMFCCGAMKTINVEKYALPDGMLFRGGAHQPVESLYFCAWFYIGLEIVPQTCEHVKDVSLRSV